MYLVTELLSWVPGSKVVHAADTNDGGLSASFGRAAPLKTARAGDIAFFFSKEYLDEIPFAKPSVLVIGEPFAAPLLASGLPLLKTTVIVSAPDPYYAMAVISGKVALLCSTVVHPVENRSDNEIHPSAVIHPTAQLGKGVRIDANAVVEKDAVIGDGVVLYPSVYVGPRAKIGAHSVLFPRVVIYEDTVMGERTRLHAGVVLGADGFGYAPVIVDGKPVNHQKIYHMGRVVLGDDVEIGAGSLIDRGTFGDTTIGSKVKIDNHCHIGHNCAVDDGSILCGAVCLIGGATIGKFAYIGGMSGVGAHVSDYAKVGAMTQIAREVPVGGQAFGIPQREPRAHFKLQALLQRMLDEYDSNKKKRAQDGARKGSNHDDDANRS